MALLGFALGAPAHSAVFKREDSIWLRKKHLDKAHAFFEKYGGRAVILARFVPIVRTYAPFVAGAASMTYAKFALFNVSGAVLWVVSLGYAGYFFGNLPFIKNNLTLVILGIIFLSILPGIIEILRQRRAP